MTTILLKENEPFEVAIRRFRRAIEKNGLIAELRERQSYEKPTTARKRKKAAAVKRLHKRLRSQQLPKKLHYARFSSTAERRCELRKKPHRRFVFRGAMPVMLPRMFLGSFLAASGGGLQLRCGQAELAGDRNQPFLPFPRAEYVVHIL